LTTTTDKTSLDRTDARLWELCAVPCWPPDRQGQRPEEFRLHTYEQGNHQMKITYDTNTDSIHCPDLSPDQNKQLQHLLSAALVRNDPVQTIAATIMAAVRAAQRTT
jgi:hypothetical protein